MAAKGKRSVANEHIREMNERKTLVDEQKRLDKLAKLRKGYAGSRPRSIRDTMDTEAYFYG